MTNRDVGKTVRDIHRATQRKFSAEEKIRTVLEGFRGEERVSELCRKESIADDQQRAEQEGTAVDTNSSS